MNKECEAIQESLSVHLDGELTGDRLTDLQGHLSSCQSCQRIVKDYHRISQLLREQVSAQTARVDLGTLREKVLERVAPYARLRPTGRIGSGTRRYRWQVAWALGLAMAIAAVWFGPKVWETQDQLGPSALSETIQEQLGQAIRDAAILRLAAQQVSGCHQEQLGRLIRDHPQSSIQEQLGLLIRDHAHSRWIMDQQWGQLQERIGRLIQDQARHQSM